MKTTLQNRCITAIPHNNTNNATALFFNTIYNQTQTMMRKTQLKSIAFLLMLLCLGLSKNAQSQLIVETFEQAAWTTVAATGAGSSVINATVATSLTTSTNQTISTYSNKSTTATVAVTTAAPRVTGNWSWVYSAGSVFAAASLNSGDRKHSAANSWSINKHGYIITPMVNQGIASVTIWVTTGGSTAAALMGLNTNTTQVTYGGFTTNSSSTTSSTQNGFISGVLPSTFTFNSSVATTLVCSMTSAGASFSFAPNSTNTMPAQFGFFPNGTGTYVTVDDIVITPALSDITTGTAGSITSNSAIISNNILTNSSTSAVTENGICYNTSPTPTTANSKVVNGVNTNGSFSSNLSGLSIGSTYYVRAYATNSKGTYYGSQITVSPVAPEPTNYPTNFAGAPAATSSQSSITVTWTDATGGTLPHSYLVRGSAVSFAAITAPSDGTPVADGALDKNVAAGTQSATFTGLSGTYFFKIYSYTNTLTDINFKTDATPPSVSASTAANTVAGQPFRSSTSGNWSAVGTWQSFDGTNWVSATSIPDNTTTSTISIRDGHTVTIDQTANMTSLTVGGGTSGALVYQNTATIRAVTVSGNITVATGGSFTCGTQTSSVIHTLAIGGSLTVNGTGSFSMAGSSTTKACNTTFNGSDVTIGGTTSNTLAFNKLSINLASSTNTITPSVNISTASTGLDLTQGKWQQNSATTTTSGGSTWGVNSEMSVNGGTFTHNGGSVIENGKLTVISGTVNIGNGTGNSLTYGNGASINISGGTVNIAGRFSYVTNTNTVSFTMSGGILNLVTQGSTSSTASFDLATTGCSFTMSGGTIILQNPSSSATPIAYRNLASTVNVTGGTVQFGNGSTAAASTFVVSNTSGNTTTTFPNLTINSFNSPTVQLGHSSTTSLVGINVYGDITIGSGTTLNAATSTNTVAKTITLLGNATQTGNWINNGTFTNNGSTVAFSGTGAQSITKSGGESFDSLKVNKASGTLTLNNNVTAGNLAITAGTLDANGNNINDAGNWTNAGSFTAGSGLVTLNGATLDQTITNASGESFSNLTVNKATSGNVILANNVSVSGTLTLTKGLVTTSTNTLSVGSSGSISGASSASYVNGNLRKNITSGSNVSATYPIGDASNYLPLSLSFASVSAAGDLTASINTPASAEANYGSFPLSTTAYVNRYWTLTNANTLAFTNYTATLNYATGDKVGGATVNSVKLGLYSGGAWTTSTPTTSAANSNTTTALTGLGDIILANCATSVTPSVAIAAIPGINICAGASVTFTATPTDGGSAPTYQWKVNGGNVGSGTDTYITSTLADGDVVTCTMTANNFCQTSATANSNSLTITVSNPGISPTVSISNDLNDVCANVGVTFTATPTNGGASPSYNFKVNGVSKQNGSSPTYVSYILANNDVVTCTITRGDACANSTNSNSIPMTIKATPSAPVFTAGPTSNCTIGSSTNMYADAWGGVWASSNTGVATLSTGTSGNSSKSITAIANGTTNISYTLTNPTTGCASAVTTVYTVAQVSVIAISSNSSACAGGAAFTATNNTDLSGGLTSVWGTENNRVSISNGGLVTPGTSAGTGIISYTVTNPANGCSTKVTKSITIFALPNIPNVNVSPSIGSVNAICPGKTYQFTGSPSGGVWATTAPGTVATLSGGGQLVTVGAGSATLTYTVKNVNDCSNTRSFTGTILASCFAREMYQPTVQSANQQFNLYPNPAKGVVSISVGKLIGKGAVVVTDIYGKTVMNKQIQNDIQTLDISALNKGIYLVNIITNAGKTTKKLIVE